MGIIQGMNKFFEVFRNKKFKEAIAWVGGIVAAKIADTLFGVNFFTVSNLFLLIKYVVKILNFPLPLGVLLLFFLVSIESYILIKRWGENKNKTSRPAFLGYTQDIFKGIPYQWEYILSNKKYRIGRVAIYCPTCISRIVNNKCQECEAPFWDMKGRDEIIAMILHNLEVKFKINEFEALGE
jgi:hypothetical protein